MFLFAGLPGVEVLEIPVRSPLASLAVVEELVMEHHLVQEMESWCGRCATWGCTKEVAAHWSPGEEKRLRFSCDCCSSFQLENLNHLSSISCWCDVIFTSP